MRTSILLPAAGAASFVLLLGSLGESRPNAVDELQEELAQLARGAVLDESVHGLSLMVAVDGATVAEVGEGVAGCDPEPAGGRTRYAAGGIFDVYLSLAAARLSVSGALDLDAEVASLLEGFPFEAEGLTVRHLMAHAGGLPSIGDLPDADTRPAGEGGDPEAELLRRLATLPMESAPGSCQEYSSGGILVLGLVLEAVTESSVEDLLGTHVFEPLGLEGTDFEGPRSRADREHRRFLGPEAGSVELQPLPFGAHRLRTSATDLLAIANGLASAESESLRAALLEPVPIEDGEDGVTAGLLAGDLEDFGFFSFGGASDSCAIQCAVYPEMQLAIAVCASSGEAPVVRFERRAARLVFGVPEPGIRDLPLPDGAERTYAGEYQIGCDTHVVGIAGGRLRLVDAQGGALELLHQGEHAFVAAADPDVRVVFQVIDDLADGFYLDQHGATSYAKRIR